MIDLIAENRFIAQFTNQALRLRLSVKNSRTTGVIFATNSSTFNTPLVGAIREILGLIDDFNETEGLNLAAQIDARLEIGGAVISRGYLQVIKIVVNATGANEVELCFFGDQANLKALFGSITLADIYRNITRPYRITGEIKNYFDNPLSFLLDNGIAYPIIDYGQNYRGVINNPETQRNINEPLSQLDFKPSVSFQKILEDGFNYFGLTYVQNDTDILNKHRRLVMPFHNNSSQIFVNGALDNDDLAGIGLNANLSINTAYVQSAFPPIPINQLTLNNIQFDINSNVNAAFRYVAPYSGSFIFQYRSALQLDLIYSLDAGVFGNFPRVDLQVNKRLTVVRAGNIIQQFSLATTNFVRSNGIGSAAVVNATFNNTITNENAQPIEVNLLEGDEVFISIAWATRVQNGSFSQTNINLLTSDTSFQCIETPAVNSASLFDLGLNAPKITFFDFYQSAIQQFCGVPQFLGNDTFTFLPYETWIESNGKLINGDSLIDLSKFVIKPVTQVNNYKSIRLTYQSDKDFLNELFEQNTGRVYGTALITDTGNQFSTEEFRIESKFAPTPISFIPDSGLIAPRFLNQQGQGVEVKPRFLTYQGNRNLQTILLRDLFDTSNTFTYTSIALFGHYTSPFGGYAEPNFDFNFGGNPTFFTTNPPPKNNLFSKWQRYLRELFSPDARFFEGQIKTELFDAFSLELNEKVYFQNTNFAIEEIENINAKEVDLATLKMYKRIPFEPSDIAPLNPVDIINNVVQWVNVQTGLPEPTPTPEVLQLSCEAYGFTYDLNNNVCVFRPNIIQI